MSNTQNIGLSKSKYTSFCHCAKQLWLKKYKPEVEDVTDDLQDRFNAGNEIGDLAMGLFGDYVDVTTKQQVEKDGKSVEVLDLKKMVEKTRELLDGGKENICEASFFFKNNYCAVDILRKVPGGYSIYEVKSSSDGSSFEKKITEYARDIAYQKFILENNGLNIVGTYLVNINHEYVLEGDLDIQKLFKIHDFSEYVAKESDSVKDQIAKATECLASEQEPKINISESCSKPYSCTFWKYCSKHLPNPSVFDLYNSKSKWKYYNQGLRKLSEVPTAKLTGVTKLVTECLLENREHIDKTGIKNFLNSLTYPLYFFDFESIMPPLPIYQGTTPYQQICFQYSLHYIESENGDLKHKEFLAESGSDPSRAIAEAICRDIPKNSMVLVYNDSFEKTRLLELAKMFPDLAEHLLNVRDHIVDLLNPFKDGLYYVPKMGSSFSIKSVLPALFPDNPELNYHNLDQIHNGGEASGIFLKIKDMSPEEAQKTRENLLKYCGLDTYAMVKVVEKLKEVVK